MIFDSRERSADIIFKSDRVWHYKNIFITIPKNEKYILELFYTKNNIIYFSILTEEKIELGIYNNIFLLKESNFNVVAIDVNNKRLTLLKRDFDNSWYIKSSQFKRIK